MDAEWGGLETLIAAAEFVELQEKEQKNQKLIEICGKLNLRTVRIHCVPNLGIEIDTAVCRIFCHRLRFENLL